MSKIYSLFSCSHTFEPIYRIQMIHVEEPATTFVEPRHAMFMRFISVEVPVATFVEC